MFIRAPHDDSALAAFRDEVRSFCETELPADIRRKVNIGQHLEKDDYDVWFKALAARKWHVGRWPSAFGGHGWGASERVIFDEETGKAGAPWLIPFGVTMVGPVIYTFGTDEHKQRFLPGIVKADTWWCQGYSEPGAGSDLAGLQDPGRARRRPLRRQRPEDLDVARPLGRLDLLPRAHQRERQEAGRHLVPADRHEDTGHHRAADHRPSTWRTISTRCSSTTCACPSPIASARRTRAGPTPSSCSPTSVSAPSRSASSGVT